MMSEQLLEQLNHPDPARRKAAIQALARGEVRAALPRLAQMHRADPDAGVRDLALKAGRYIYKKTDRKTETAPPAASPEPATPPTAAAPEPADDSLDIAALSPEPPPGRQPVSEAASDEAVAITRRAVQLYQRGDRQGALFALGEALDLDPNLREHSLVRELAVELTGQDASSALTRLSDPTQRDRLTPTPQRSTGQRPAVRSGTPNYNLVIALALIILFLSVIAVLVLFNSGLLPGTP